MTLKPEFWSRARRVLTAPASHRFVALLSEAGLDPSTDLRHGDLRGCDLSGEDCAGFDFTGANLTGANLLGADLSRAIGVDRAEGLDSALFDETTRWPPEPWSDAAGRDAFGRWAGFTVTGADGSSVTQRLRWCPPGSFLMGSPEDEEGRYDDEGPLQPITFAKGFWLFETPVTQALWMAVIGGRNPSEFPGPDRPVENVSFWDATRFTRRLNRTKRGLALSLPSQAQWEYGCRAGTVEATYDGPALVHGQDNVAVLDRIAWYGRNSGDETHPVRLKAPNKWGLYDTLGNVWEWCADEWHASHDGASPVGAARDRGDRAADRVVRGGAWDTGAGNLRAAYRVESGPTDRVYSLGFRCARVLARPGKEGEGRAAGGGKRRQWSDRTATASRPQRAGGAG